MKIIKIKKVIKYNLLISFFIILIIVGLVIIYNTSEQKLSEEYNKIINETNKISDRASDLEEKSRENKKYIQLWSKIDAKKKHSEAIKTNDINNILDNLAEKYSIVDKNLKMSSPEKLPDSVFNNKNANLLYILGELNFLAYHDINAIKFANEFINSLQGYPIVTDFKISREKEYDNQYLFDISTNKNNGAIKGKVTFSWYSYAP